MNTIFLSSPKDIVSAAAESSSVTALSAASSCTAVSSADAAFYFLTQPAAASATAKAVHIASL